MNVAASGFVHAGWLSLPQQGSLMPLAPMMELLQEAERGGYAVCYCEAWNLESLEAVVQAAEESRSPIITGFNGGFLSHPARSKPENLAYYSGMGLGGLKETPVPVAFLLNETDDFAQIEGGIKMGFNAVMVENERLEMDEYRRLVRRVVRVACGAGVSVEAAIGRLPGGSGHPKAQITDPVSARTFVEDTRIDALAVSVGNVHILTAGKASIDLDALRKIREAVKIPLVLHGGSGVPLELARSLIRLGVTKINFGTTLKQAYLAAIREKLAEYREPMNPHPFLGMGTPQDILGAGREAVKTKVRELVSLCGSTGKARVI